MCLTTPKGHTDLIGLLRRAPNNSLITLVRLNCASKNQQCKKEEKAVDIFNEDVWPSTFDDRNIDNIIWEEIKDSDSRGDCICYLLHRPQKAQHRDDVQARLKTLESTDSTPVGYGRAVQRIQKLAENGDPNALFHMGKLTVLGIGVPQNMRMAETWYHKAIEAGEMRAHCNMGWIYLYGFGEIPPNKDEAYRLLSLGAENGVFIAKASLGLMLLQGDGVPADPERGLQLLSASFEAGYTQAGNHLAEAYLIGKYIPRDIEIGHDWLAKAAATGDERTMATLGYYLVAGSYGKTDIGRGITLLQDAAEKGYAQACQWLGNFYRNGQGVLRDGDKALEWFERGSEAGNTACDKALAEMRSESMNPAAPENTMLQ